MKTIVIVKHNAREFANQLWNDLSIAAYGMEIGARIINITFLEHSKLLRYIHIALARVIDFLMRKTCAVTTTETMKFLPPTSRLSEKFNSCRILFFFGWLFRNTVGMEKYRNRLIEKFIPSGSALRRAQTIIASLPQGLVLIGVCMRMRPFEGFENGEFLISPARVRTIIDEYVRERGLDAKNVALVIASDMEIIRGEFGGYANVVCTDNEETRLFLLSKCSVVIGTNSTFSNLAAWFGNVPHIVTSKEPIDWQYYQNRSIYFENKYATFTHGSLVYP